jgi:hypothetical protein
MTEWSELFSLHLACVARCWVLIILASVACLAEKHGRIADAPDPEFGSNVDSGASGAEESLSRLSFSPPGLSFGSLCTHPGRGGFYSLAAPRTNSTLPVNFSRD